LLIGLHDDDGVLQMVGAIGAFPMATRTALVGELAPLALPEDAVHPWHQPFGRTPGMPSRWRSANDRSWYPLRPVRVVEVSYDQATSGRLRHVATFQRWRPDKEPTACLMSDLHTPPPLDIRSVLDG
jgi:ATP-dependent DNA ligase